MKKILAPLFLSSLILGTGCGAIDREVDCNRICEKKKECADNNYNVSACVDYCRSQAKSSASYAQKVNDCGACIETRACAEVAECYLKSSCPSIP